MRLWLCPPSRPEQQLALGLVERGAPLDELADVPRRLADDHLDDLAIAQPGAGGERVGDVILEPVVGAQHAGDAALGVVAVGLLELVLGDDQRREPRIDRHRRPQPGDAAADDQHVDEVVRHPLGMKGDEVAGDVGHDMNDGKLGR